MVNLHTIISIEKKIKSEMVWREETVVLILKNRIWPLKLIRIYNDYLLRLREPGGGGVRIAGRIRNRLEGEKGCKAPSSKNDAAVAITNSQQLCLLAPGPPKPGPPND